MAEPRGPEKFEGIIFDLDGTLIDSYVAITDSLNHARARYDLDPLDPGTVRYQVGRGLETLVAELVGEDRVDAGVKIFRERYAQIFREFTLPLDGALEVLRQLPREGYRLAVASNKPARFSNPILAHLSMLAPLACVAGPDTVGATKPDPRMLRHCMTQLASPPGKTLYVGDMLLDVVTADRADVDVALVCGGSSTREQLESTGRPVLSSLSALPDWLNARSRSG